MKILGKESNLSRSLDEICNRISSLDAVRDGPALFKQILSARPDLQEKLDAVALQTSDPTAAKLSFDAIGVGMLATVKNEVPQLITTLVTRINDRATDPALRCALVSVLAYVVRPRDLVPDDAPGGYGFVDDNALLQVVMLQLTEATSANASAIEERQKRLACLESSLPPGVVPSLQLAMQGILLMFQSMRMLPAQIADAVTQRILEDPLAATAPQAPPGWVPPSLSPPGGGHWSGGAYFEDGNVVIPGGPALVNGQFYIPGA